MATNEYNPALAGLAGQVGGLNVPQPGAMPRTLYDKYSNLLMDPTQIANDPAYQLMMEQAQKASTRSLSAGRMSKSGNAAIQAAKVATGTSGQYLKQLSDLYGQGATTEANRYGVEAGAQSGGFRDLMSRYQLQGSLLSGGGVASPTSGPMFNTQANIPGYGAASGGMMFNPQYGQPLPPPGVNPSGFNPGW
jgi:hypothetical protein